MYDATTAKNRTTIDTHSATTCPRPSGARTCRLHHPSRWFHHTPTAQAALSFHPATLALANHAIHHYREAHFSNNSSPVHLLVLVRIYRLGIINVVSLLMHTCMSLRPHRGSAHLHCKIGHPKTIEHFPERKCVSPRLPFGFAHPPIQRYGHLKVATLPTCRCVCVIIIRAFRCASNYWESFWGTHCHFLSAFLLVPFGSRTALLSRSFSPRHFWIHVSCHWIIWRPCAFFGVKAASAICTLMIAEICFLVVKFSIKWPVVVCVRHTRPAIQ